VGHGETSSNFITARKWSSVTVFGSGLSGFGDFTLSIRLSRLKGPKRQQLKGKLRVGVKGRTNSPECLTEFQKHFQGLFWRKRCPLQQGLPINIDN
jgi:hypothetical protein